MAIVTKSVAIETEIETDIEIDLDEIRELVSDEGLSPGDLFSDSEIRDAAEGSADWEWWLEKAIDEMGDRSEEMLSRHGYAKAYRIVKPDAIVQTLRCMEATRATETVLESGHYAGTIARLLLRSLPEAERAETIAEFAPGEKAIREKIKAEILSKLFA